VKSVDQVRKGGGEKLTTGTMDDMNMLGNSAIGDKRVKSTYT
jgi:hypothetical protein